MKTLKKVLAGVLLPAVGMVVLAAWGQQQGANGVPNDWSHHHLIFSRPSSAAKLAKLQKNPRYLIQQASRSRGTPSSETFMRALDTQAVQLATSGTQTQLSRSKSKPTPVPNRIFHRDWGQALNATINASTTTIIPNYAAKFDVFGNSPSCTADFVVFTVPNSPKSTTSFNIIGFNNLYVSPSGACSGTNPTAIFDYNASTATGGTLQSGPVVSVDPTGSKIAFVENASAANGGAVFHVLRWSSGNTKTYPTPFNDTGVLTDCNTNNTAPCEFSLAYTTPAAGATLSAPFPDYFHDIAYLSDNNGTVYAISPVFNASQGNPPAVLWSKQVGTAGAVMTPPVFDQTSGNVFVGDSNGKVSFIRTTSSTVGACSGTPENIVPPCIGSNSFSFTGTGASISDAPIVDSASGSVYVFGTGVVPLPSSPSGSWVVQLNTALSSTLAIAGLGPLTPGVSIYDGTFDDTYFNGTQLNGHIIGCGRASIGGPELFQYGFTTSGANTVIDTTNIVQVVNTNGTAATPCSPITENKVTSGTPKEAICGSVSDKYCAGCGPGGTNITGGCVQSYDLPLFSNVIAKTTCNVSKQNKTVTCPINTFTQAEVGDQILCSGCGFPVPTIILSVSADGSTATVNNSSQNDQASSTITIVSAPDNTAAEPDGTTAIIIDNTVDVSGTTTDIFTETQGTQSCAKYSGGSSTSSCGIMLTQSGLM